MTEPRFASVVLDADSTLSGVEGIDWLAGLRDPTVALSIEQLTAKAMTGEIRLDAIYGERLSIIRPTEREIAALAEEYCARLAVDAIDVIARLRAAGVALRIVSGGIRQALMPLAESLGFRDSELHAVSVVFAANGDYAGYEEDSPLTSADGKATVVTVMNLPSPILAVGDGATDLAMRPSVDTFAAFTGFERRRPIVESADLEIRSFEELQAVVLG